MQKRKKLNTNIINVILIFIIFIGLIIYMLKVDDIDNIINVLTNANITWMSIGLLCIVAYWLLEALCLYVVTKKTYKHQKYFDSLRVSMIGQLFNSITPFSSGRSANASRCNGIRRKKYIK